MNYQCPHCKGNWTLGETIYRGGQVFACTSCNKQSVIPLYCPTCCPAAITQKKWLETPDGHLGGQAFRCPSGHSFSVPVTRDEAHRRLREMGNEVGQYHQSTRIETLRDADTKEAVKGGYCSGACYDWIRRVLVSNDAKVTYRNFEGTLPKVGQLTGEMAGQHRQDHRAALMQMQDKKPLLQAKDTERVKQYDTWLQERKKQQSASENVAFERYKGDLEAERLKYRKDRTEPDRIYSQEIDRLNERRDIDFATKQSLAEKATQTYKASLAAIDAAYQKNSMAQDAYDRNLKEVRSAYDLDVAARKAGVDSARAQPVLQQIWAEYRKQMDEAIEKQRRAMGKTGFSARPFSNLDLVAASDSVLYTEGLGQLIDAVLNHPDFKPDFCAHLGVNPPDGSTGHAVAIHRQNTGGKYHLFDPNFGVYELTKDKAREAFLFLFRTAYPCWAGGGTSDDKRYEVNGKTKGSYGIFRGNRVTAPAVVEERPPQSSTRVEVTVTLKQVSQMPKIAVTAQHQARPVVTATKTVPAGAAAGVQQAQPKGPGGGPWRREGGKWVR